MEFSSPTPWFIYQGVGDSKKGLRSRVTVGAIFLLPDICAFRVEYSNDRVGLCYTYLSFNENMISS